MLQSLEFLKANGTLISHAVDVKIGDIVGRANTGSDVRIYCVENVILNPVPPYLLPAVPRVYFKAPHIGLALKNNKVFRHYIHTPMPGESYQYAWGEYTDDFLSAEIDNCKDDEDYKRAVLNEVFEMYLITNENYKNLGSLINDVEVPNWSMLKQTIGSEQPIFDFVNSVRDDLKLAREIYERVRDKASL